MGTGGLGSLILGKLFDRIGLIVLVPCTIVAVGYAALCLLGSFGPALLGSVLWGAGLGAHEFVMQAPVAEMIPLQRLGAAYGLFAGFFGVSCFVGSAAMGSLYDFSIPAVAWLAVVAQMLAIFAALDRIPSSACSVQGNTPTNAGVRGTGSCATAGRRFGPLDRGSRWRRVTLAQRSFVGRRK